MRAGGRVMRGRGAAILFVAAALASSVLIYWLWRLYQLLTRDPTWTFRRAVLPALVIQSALLLFYFFHLVPPVPLVPPVEPLDPWF